ncbi:hypothetical protein [Mycoplasmopsis cynos]|uniref:hypothetical protein n=1 Tax=Mycoplasmopsis cynos TaxID=171284 RepID=UPI00220C872E|nr:hypothetical protein [Mycoplasmopsis cynos]UWV82248.1 hypothetical protein NW067_04380 [Mycoplasmopsis cynos]
MLILGIETSHDDTSLALLEDGKVLDMWTISQIDIFKEFGGAIPELASREQRKKYFNNSKNYSKKIRLNKN